MSTENDSDGAKSGLPEYYREIVSILFGIVFAQSLPHYLTYITLQPGADIEVQWLPFLALLSSHIAIALSWVGYHNQLAAYDYTPENIWGEFKMSIDVIIVILYFGLISLANRLSSAPGEGVNWGVIYFLLSYVLIFLFYVLNDKILQQGYKDREDVDESEIGYVLLNGGLAMVFGILIAVYFTSGSIINIGVEGYTLSLLAVITTIVIVICYRIRIAKSGTHDSIGPPFR